MWCAWPTKIEVPRLERRRRAGLWFLSSGVDTLCTSWDNITHYKTKSVNFLGLMNSATKVLRWVKVLCLPLLSGSNVLNW